MTRVLCLTRSEPTSQFVEAALGASAHVKHACDFASMRQALHGHETAAVVIDCGDAGSEMLEAIAELRAQRHTARTPIIVLTSGASLSITVSAFALGADDVLPRDVHPLELKARIDSRVRRADVATREVVLDGLRVDFERQRAWAMAQEREVPLDLTVCELRLLVQLMMRPGVVRSRDQLLDAVWGAEVAVLDRTVDVHVSHLRRKLGSSAWTIETVPRVGYRLHRRRAAAQEGAVST